MNAYKQSKKSEDFREEVCNIIKENNYKTIVEVGVWKGELSRQIAELDIETLFMVDPMSLRFNDFNWNGGRYQCTMGEKLKTEKELDEICKQLETIPKTKFIRKTSVEAAEEFMPQSVDLVFIDAIHTYEDALEDIKVWLPKIREGGMITGDDFVPKDNAVSRAVTEMFPQWDRVWGFYI